MKLHLHLLAIPLLGFIALPVSADDPACLAAYKTEEARITREHTARPPGNDPVAQQRWALSLHTALEGAVKRARQCEEDVRRSPAGQAAQRDALARHKVCTDTAERQLADLRLRFAGRSNLSREEQTAQREAEMRIVDTRMTCMGQGR